MLANIVSLYKNVVVAGSHGKTKQRLLFLLFSQSLNLIQLQLMEE